MTVAPTHAARPDLSIVVVSWNARGALIECLESVERAASEVALELTVVDNGSLDSSAEAVRDRFPAFRLIANRRNAGFARANNQAFPGCRGRYVLLLNPDTIVTASALRGLVSFMDETADAGAAGLQLEHADGRLQNSYDSFPGLASELLSKHLLRFLFPRKYPSKRTIPKGPIEVDIVIGACLILRPEVLHSLGGFDDGYFLFAEEADLCHRIWKSGWKIYHVPDLSIRHTYHFSKERAPAHATLESYRSNYRLFRKHSPRAVALAYRWLKTIKLVCISVTLSVIACVFTLGTSARHRRRLAIRSFLAAWHLLGCPRSWGMRQVSGFRGYRRLSTSSAEGRRLVFVREGVSDALARFLEDPVRELESNGAARTLKSTRTKTSLRTRVDGRTLLVTIYRPRRALDLQSLLTIPKGIWTFERAMEVSDQGIPTIPPLAAGSLARFGLTSHSFVIFEEKDELEPLMKRIAGGGLPARPWFGAYGRFVRRMHDLGITQYDLNPGNALVRGDLADAREDAIILVDLERVSVGPPIDWSARRRALGRLNRIQAGITSRDRLRFLRGYCSRSALNEAHPRHGPVSDRRFRHRLTREVLALMSDLHAGDGRRAERNCTRENWFFGRIDADAEIHFRRRAYPWDDGPLLDESAAIELADRALGDVALGDGLETRAVTNGAGGIGLWRRLNREFQSGANGDVVPLLFVRRGGLERVVVRASGTESEDVGGRPE